jgi:DNA-binding beta-propeller fold protein YncE
VDGTGKVYLTDDSNLARVQVFTSAGSFIAAWGSEGAGTGQFFLPQAVAVDASGNIYVADGGNNRIQKFGSMATPTRATSWGRLKRMYR